MSISTYRKMRQRMADEKVKKWKAKAKSGGKPSANEEKPAEEEPIEQDGDDTNVTKRARKKIKKRPRRKQRG